MLLEDYPQLFFGHIRAHMSSTDAASILNCVADRLAVMTHTHPFSWIAPLPTFALDQYAMWAEGVGFIENNFSLFVDGELACIHATSLHYTSGDWFPHLSISIPQSFPYEHSTSSYSALVQLYARSGQLPTQCLLFLRGMAPSSWCRFGCYCTETPHHLYLFIKCPWFTEYHQSTLCDIHWVTSGLVESIPSVQCEMVLSAISTLLVDDNSHFTWPLGHNMWYYGHSPYITKGFPFLPDRIVQSLSQAWHSCFIHLVGRIWGHVQRCGTFSWRYLCFSPFFFLAVFCFCCCFRISTLFLLVFRVSLFVSFFFPLFSFLFFDWRSNEVD